LRTDCDAIGSSCGSQLAQICHKRAFPRIHASYGNLLNSSVVYGSGVSTGTGFQQVGHVLRLHHPELVASKRRLRRAETIYGVRAKREAETQNLGFSSRPFVLCGLPVKRPAAGCLLHQRRNSSSCRSPDTRVMDCLGDKTDSSPFFLRHWQSGSRARRSLSTAPPRCLTPSACSREGHNTVASSDLFNGYSGRRFSSARTRRGNRPPSSIGPGSTL